LQASLGMRQIVAAVTQDQENRLIRYYKKRLNDQIGACSGYWACRRSGVRGEVEDLKRSFKEALPRSVILMSGT
jgi:hypothetical protein